MKIFDFFRKKEKKEIVEEEYKEEEVLNNNPVCELCEKEILEWEKRKTHANKKFHVGCYRKALKNAKKQIKSGLGNL